ncbi:hypothetical protein [Cellulomonas sp. PSBB021]|uniref:hypothetical protein n=1 Tax=Cellulomonas sp. PSBB021 TaxID=2003551 RepID=UPI0012FE250D|nr:hypothetical protein [Cellulomonas sp. PSBB021]
MTDASSVTTAAVLGAVAGLSVAVPVGPVAVLIVREALVRGRSAGLAAAGGVASVDLAYAMVAVLLGTQVSRLLTGHEQWLRVGGRWCSASSGWRGSCAGGARGTPRPSRCRRTGRLVRWTAVCCGCGRGSSSSPR